MEELGESRAVANRKIGRAYQAMKSVRIFLVCLAVVGGIAFVILLGAEGEYRDAILAGQGVAIVLFLVGAWRITKEPLLWALLAACVQTLLAVASPGILFIFLALACWAAAGAVAPAKRLMKQYPELRITRRIRGERYGQRR